MILDQGPLGDVAEPVFVVPTAIGAATLGVSEEVVRFKLIDTCLPLKWNSAEFQPVVNQGSRSKLAG